MRNVIVTGGSRGLGLAIVKKLLRDGFCVIAVSRTSGDELQSLLSGSSGFHFAYDFSDRSGIEALVRDIQSRCGSIFGLVNNAAVGLSGTLATESPAKIEQVIGVNLLAPILMTRAVVRGMIAGGGGRIVNISSINAFTGYSGLAAYGATKSGLIGFTKSLAREVGKAGISVNAVAPGLLETEMSKSISAERREKIQRRSPLKRFATVDEVAAAVSYLLADTAAGITGTTITVDAGNSA